MTRPKQARAARWAAWEAMTAAERAEHGIATVYTPDRSEHGFAVESGAECRCGGAGACSFLVVWPDGAATICCTRGMESIGDEGERMPGGFGEWSIR